MSNNLQAELVQPQLQNRVSTAMPNNLQAGMGTASSCRRGQGQNAAQLFFLKCLHSESSDSRFLLFPITIMSPLPPDSNSLFATVYNKLSRGGCCCVSPSEHPAHLTPAFCMFVFCLFSISLCFQLGFQDALTQAARGGA
jgi:hypothetical protein